MYRNPVACSSLIINQTITVPHQYIFHSGVLMSSRIRTIMVLSYNHKLYITFTNSTFVILFFYNILPGGHSHHLWRIHPTRRTSMANINSPSDSNLRFKAPNSPYWGELKANRYFTQIITGSTSYIDFISKYLFLFVPLIRHDDYSGVIMNDGGSSSIWDFEWELITVEQRRSLWICPMRPFLVSFRNTKMNALKH